MHEEGRRGTESDQAPPEDRPDEPGAEGAARAPRPTSSPGAPADDDAPLGDTDQHSDA